MKQKRRALIQLVLLSAVLLAGCGKSGETNNVEPDGTEDVWNLETVSEETEIAEQEAEVPEESSEETPSEVVFIKRITRHEEDGTTIVDNYEEYDEAGNLIKAIRYRRDGSISTWFEKEYDAFGNQTKHIFYDEDGSISSWFEDEYDSAGNPLNTTKFDGKGSIVSWCENEYDADGNLARSSYYNGDGSFDWGQKFEYDASGNLLTKTSYNRDGDISERSENTYDSYGNLIMESWYSYHEDGSLFEWYEYEYITLDDKGSGQLPEEITWEQVDYNVVDLHFIFEDAVIDREIIANSVQDIVWEDITGDGVEEALIYCDFIPYL